MVFSKFSDGIIPGPSGSEARSESPSHMPAKRLVAERLVYRQHSRSRGWRILGPGDKDIRAATASDTGGEPRCARCGGRLGEGHRSGPCARLSGPGKS